MNHRNLTNKETASLPAALSDHVRSRATTPHNQRINNPCCDWTSLYRSRKFWLVHYDQIIAIFDFHFIHRSELHKYTNSFIMKMSLPSNNLTTVLLAEKSHNFGLIFGTSRKSSLTHSISNTFFTFSVSEFCTLQLFMST